MDKIIPTTKGLFIFGLNFDQQATREFAINLFDWSGNNHGAPLRININSLGGNPLDALFLFETFGQLRKLGHHLTIAVNGRCASCASWLLQAADKRVIGANSWLMFHQIRSAADGDINAIKRELARDEQLNEQTIQLLCSRSNLTPAQVHEQIDDGKDWWISAEEALTHRLVDAVEYAPEFDCTNNTQSKPKIKEPIPSIFVVTVMEDRGIGPRAIGWLPTIEAALEVVKTDDGRIPSVHYTYALIEEAKPGIYEISKKQRWFEWRDGAWQPLGAPGNPATPHWAIGTVNWGLG